MRTGEGARYLETKEVENEDGELKREARGLLWVVIWESCMTHVGLAGGCVGGEGGELGAPEQCRPDGGRAVVGRGVMLGDASPARCPFSCRLICLLCTV